MASQEELAAESVAAAIVAIQAPNTGSAQRAEAQAFIDDVKANPASLAIVTSLLGHANSDAVRHFALQIIEHSVKYNWKLFDGEAQAGIKSLVLDILDGGTKSLTDEIHFIKNKLVDIFLLLLLHDWPQKWPELFGLLSDIGLKSDTHAELVLRIICDASDELLRLSRAVMTGEDTHVTLPRRKQLCEAFRDSMSLLYPFLWACLAQQGEAYESIKHQAASGNSEALADFGAKALLVDVALKGVVSLLNWVPLEYLDERPIVPLAMAFIGDTNFCMLSVEALEALISRKHVRTSEPHIMKLFDHMPTLFAMLTGAPMFDSLEKQHTLNMMIINCLVEVGLFQFRMFQRAASEAAVEGEGADPAGPGAVLHSYLQTYLQTMMELADAHPSIDVQLSLLNLWRSLLSSGLIQRGDKLAESELLTYVLHIQLRLLLMRNPWYASPGSPELAFAQLDFSSEEDAEAGWKTLERRATAIISLLTRFDGHGLVAFAVQYVAHVLSAIDANSMAYDKASDEYRAIRASGQLMTTVLRSLPRICLVPSDETAFSLDFDFDLLEDMADVPKSDEQNELETQQRNARLEYVVAMREQTCASLSEILDSILSFSPVAPVMLSAKMRLLAGFSPFLKHFPSQLLLAFNTAFDQILYRHPSDAGVHVESLGEDSLRVRVKATKTVRLLFLYVGESMTELLEHVWTRVQELEAAGELRHEEKVSLFEVVLISASKVREDDLQSAVISAILAPVLGQWCSPELAATMGEPRALLSALGLIGNPGQAGSGRLFSDAHMTFRNDLYYLVSVLYIVTKWSAGWRSRALLPHASNILLPLFTLVQALHQIWLPVIAAEVPEHLQGFYRIPDEADATLMARASGLPQHGLEPALQLRLMIFWTESLQSRCYSVLGCMTKLREVFGFPELPGLLEGSVFSCLDYLPSRFLSALHVSVVGPLFRMVPPEHRDTVVLPFLLQWLQFMQSKLPADWQAFYARQDSDDKQMTPEEEVLVDTALSRLTVVHSRLLQSLSFRLPRMPTDPNDTDGDTPRPPHMLETEPLRSLFLQSSLILLQCPVLTASSIAVTLCQRLLLHIAHIPDYQGPLCTELLPALLAALTHNDDDIILRKILTLIADIYVSLTAIMPDLTRGVLSSVPGVSMDKLAELESELNANETMRDRRECFRELLAHTIGTNIIHKMYKMGDNVKEIDVINESSTTDGGL